MPPVIRRLTLGAALLAFAAPAAFARPALAQPFQETGVTLQAVQPPSLNLSAHGEVKVAPDMATISFAVVTEAPTAAEAMRLNAERMNQVMAALRRAGLNERDIQTSGLNLSAQYDYTQNEPPRLRGYQAQNRVTVVINDLARVGATADAVVAAGVNQIDGIAFGLKDPSAAQDQARRLAVQALQGRAALYADALGVRLVGVRSLTEGGGYQPQPPVMYARAETAMAAGDATPVSGGQLTVRVEVSAVYDIQR